MTSRISVVMGSKSDWGYMQEACKLLDKFGVDYDKQVISAHRMPEEMFAFAQKAAENGTKVIIAGAGGAAHLPGMIPVATTAIGPAGAKNAALLAMQILGIEDKELQQKIVDYRKEMHDQAKESSAELVY